MPKPVVTQEGNDRNDAEVNQNGDSFAQIPPDRCLSGSRSLAEPVTETIAFITQNGNSNQVGNALNASAAGVVQTGDNNFANVDQDPSTYSTAGHQHSSATVTSPTSVRSSAAARAPAAAFATIGQTAI